MKEQQSKLQTDEEMVQRRLSLEADNFAGQILALRNSLTAAQQAYGDLQAKSQHIETDLRRQLRDLTSKIQEQNEVANTLKQLALEKTNRVSVLEQEIDNMHQSGSAERSRAQSLREQATVLEAQLNTEKKLLQHQLQELQSRHNETLAHLKRCEERLKETEDMFTAQQIASAVAAREHSEQYQSLEAFNIQYKASLEGAKKEVRMLFYICAVHRRHNILLLQYEQERSALEERLSTLQSIQIALQLRCAELEKEQHTTKSDKQVLEHQQAMKILHLEAAFKQCNEAYSALQLEHAGVVSSVEQQDEIKAKFTAEIVTLQTALLAAEQTVERLKVEVQQLTTDLEHCRLSDEAQLFSKNEEVQTLRKLLDEVERGKSDQIKILKRRIESLEEALLQTGESWKKSQEELISVAGALASKERDFHAATLSSQHSEVIIDGLNRQLTSLAFQLEQLQATNAASSERISALENRQQVLLNEIDELSAGNNDLQRSNLRTVEELHQQALTNKRLQDKLEEHLKRINDLNIALVAAETNCQGLVSENSQLKNTVGELHVEIERLKAQLEASQQHIADESNKFASRVQNMNNEFLAVQVCF